MKGFHSSKDASYNSQTWFEIFWHCRKVLILGMKIRVFGCFFVFSIIYLQDISRHWNSMFQLMHAVSMRLFLLLLSYHPRRNVATYTPKMATFHEDSHHAFLQLRSPLTTSTVYKESSCMFGTRASRDEQRTDRKTHSCNP